MKQIFDQLQAEIAEICAQAGRDPRTVKVMAVSKTVGIPEVQQAIESGFHLFGENRLIGLEEKQQAFPDEQWHFIGNIQSRKIPAIVAHADMIHSVYQLSHLEAIDKAAKNAGKIQDILIEVSVSGEESKGGLEPAACQDFIEKALAFDSVRLRGLMTMAPQGDLTAARVCFEQLAQLRDALLRANEPLKTNHFDELSMGMSEDWREAVFAGATIVRIGRMIFSKEFE